LIGIPANFFQLYDASHADFQLGKNGEKLSTAERFLWLNIELYAKLIKEAGLEDELQAAHQLALEQFTATETERYARYHSS